MSPSVSPLPARARSPTPTRLGPGLHEVANYADGVGVNKNLIIPRDATGKLLAPTRLIANAHAERLLVHSWTFRAENSFLPVDFQIGDPTGPERAGEIYATSAIH